MLTDTDVFCLQSKLSSKLSQAPKLEPLNEGGGAALLQVVSVVIFHPQCSVLRKANVQMRLKTERLISVNSPDFFHVSHCSVQVLTLLYIIL